MEPVPCLHCGIFFTPRNKLQNYCVNPECQKARKAAWQRDKLRTDPDYQMTKQLSQQKWLQKNPGYWKKYRKRLTRFLQHVEAVFSPELIIIGGGISKRHEKFLRPDMLERSRVVPAQLLNEAGIVGAAAGCQMMQGLE